MRRTGAVNRWRKVFLILSTCLVILGVSYGVAAGVAGPGLAMQSGESDHVTCAGGWLSVSHRSGTGLDLRCDHNRTATSDSSSRTPIVPAPTPSGSGTSTGTPPPSGSGAATGSGAAAGTPPSSATGGWWVPPLGNQPWQWELDHPLDLASPSDMGTGATLPNGQPAPNPVIYDIDGITNPKSTVTALHAIGDHAICYIEVGSAGNYYTAADEGMTTTYFAQLQAAGELGGKVSGYPEYFLNITSPATVSIIESMINQQCAAKGFDAVETDLDETYTGGEGSTGFALTKASEEQYVTTLANYMHGLGLGWIIKNPDDTGDTFAADMEPLADAVLTEQCNQYSTCISLASYEGHKAIFNAEYAPETTAEFCAADNAIGLNGAVFKLALNGGRAPCQ